MSPSAGISFVTNAAELSVQLNAMAAKLDDPAPVLERARRLLNAQEAAVWATEGAILGQHWAQAAEPERKIDSRLMVATGTLRQSLSGGVMGSVRGNELRVGTSVPYSVFHQYGTSRMPARQIIGIAPELAQQLIEIFQQETGGTLG